MVRLLFTAGLCWLLLGTFTAALADKPAANAKPAALEWRTDLETARREALASKKPIFVRVTGDACLWCLKLEDEIALPAAQKELARWTLVVLDQEADAAATRQLHVGPIPALRVLSPQGKLIASHDGFLKDEELVAWLQKEYDTAMEPPDELLLAAGEPSVIQVLKIARLLGHRDATLREAAARRLAPHPKLAGPALLKTVREGSLTAQLTALDLLSQWKAPVEGIDPWQPETLTPERLTALETWLAEVSPEAAALVSESLSEEKRQQALLEIDRMLQGDAVAAAAAREQLARFGPGLLPDVYQRLKEATEDRERERLIALRYRLVAPPALSLQWPGGLERLADGDVAVRHRAIEELVKLATAEHERLLLELFSDPDPLVRELSLRGLKEVSGNRAASALVKLLDDPDPNVRAAVLKQLAEDAPAGMVEKISEYVAKETDADLVVHALRYFAEVKGASITEAVTPLLSHESWQVRAEAARALSKRAQEQRYSPTDDTPAIREALVKALEDEDPFVVARALEGLEYVGTSSAVPALVKAVEKNPALAPQVVEVLAKSEKMREKARPHLQQYLEHEQPGVRAAAIAGLGQIDSETIDEELAKAIVDADSRVRIAAGQTLLAVLQKLRPTDRAGVSAVISSREPATPPAADSTSGLGNLIGNLFKAIGGKKEPPNDSKPAVETPPPEDVADANPTEEEEETGKPGSDRLPAQSFGHKFDVWLEEVYQGQHRKKWTAGLVEPLEKMAQAPEPEERIVALTALIPLGQAENSATRLLHEAKEKPAYLKSVAAALPWLAWPLRNSLARELDALAQTDDQRTDLVHALNIVADLRAATLFWEWLTREGRSVSLAKTLEQALKEAYFGDRYYDPQSISARMLREATQSLLAESKQGSVLKRLVALNLLIEFAADEAPAAAKAMLAEVDAPAEAKIDLFQALLAALPEKEQAAAAVDAMQGDDAARRRVAIKYLAMGVSALKELSSGFELHVVDNSSIAFQISESGPIIPEPPKHVTPEQVRPLASDADPQVAAYAGYVLTLLGEPAGLEPLLAYWQEQSQSKKADAALDRLVYRAIAVADDPQYLPVLQQIAQRIDETAASEFYWTVRIMSGPEILKFRKELREKFGMEGLR